MNSVTIGTENLVKEGTSVSPNEVGALIGKGATGAKSCISGAWKMYEKLQSNPSSVTEGYSGYDGKTGAITILENTKEKAAHYKKAGIPID